MGSQFSEEFVLGYRAGHRDGFADAAMLMGDAMPAHQQALALGRREDQLAHLLSGGGLLSPPDATEAVTEPRPTVGASRN